MGRSSVNTIEIIRGLKEGDQVILSDMSRYDAQNQIKLER
jgi:HlyD family secretion protein